MSKNRASFDSGRRGLRMPTIIGIPLHMIIAAVAIAILLGTLLSYALNAATTMHSDLTGTTIGDGAPGKNASGLTVITEATLGPEVQRLIEDGTTAPLAPFDAARCLQQQGITDPVLIMEEVAWGGNETPGWLLVHGPVDRDTIRAAGGIVSATVVTATCGAESNTTPASARLWSGSVMIGGI